jgi:hypothetical protein
VEISGMEALLVEVRVGFGEGHHVEENRLLSVGP